MDSRASSPISAPCSISDHRRARLMLLTGLVAVAILLSGLLPAPAGAASAKPSVTTGSVWTNYYCSNDGGEEVCTKTHDGSVRLLTVSGSRFTARGVISVQIIDAGFTVVDSGIAVADGGGRFSFESDVVLCNGSSLPYMVQAYDWVAKRWSNVAVAPAC